ncbi:hypothetical protein E6W39_02680 [Kitasatospora acidiphila]|uniref:Uncharacterized protein n=1 Tax=Kitasatospora acidiphila TaxID=2567942 RepID=A0A540VX50_9ACTN|nr:hypothetical protein [Kitasatospora acidiphila]TQF01342.1 hypothetical protein E6W39_02680 [Kitasatospora acidiphila]
MSTVDKPRVEATLRLAPGEVSTLASWLRRDPALRSRVTLRQQIERADPESMGTLADVVVALSTGTTGTALSRCLLTYLKQRRTSIEITLTIGDRTLNLTSTNQPPEDLVALLRAVGEQATSKQVTSDQEAHDDNEAHPA